MDLLDEILTAELGFVYREQAQLMQEANARHRRSERSRKGGLSVSRDRQHMVEIGRKGGQKISADRAHMAEIGRKGGARARVARGAEAPAKESSDGPAQDRGAPGAGGGSGS